MLKVSPGTSSTKWSININFFVHLVISGLSDLSPQKDVGIAIAVMAA